MDSTPDEIVVTRESVQNFKDACIECDGEFPLRKCPIGMVGTQLNRTQRRKGESRKTLYIADCGDFRLVYAS